MREEDLAKELKLQPTNCRVLHIIYPSGGLDSFVVTIKS